MPTPPFTKPIVCGTDFSPLAREAADAAAALARRLGVPLLLVHAEEMPLDSPFAKAWLEPMTAALHEEAERLRKIGVEVEEIFTAGLPDEALCELALDRQASLLVVASLGKRLPARWLIGSVAERAAESATVPTLVVRHAASLQAWANGERALKVVVGVDFSTHSDMALHWVAQLRQLGTLEVKAIYVDWPPKGGAAAGLGVYAPLGLIGNNLQTEASIERDLYHRVTRILGEQGVSIDVEGTWGSIDTQLLAKATDAHADLIVIGTHQWRRLDRIRHQSVSRAIVRHSPTSVVCVPMPEATAEPATGPKVRDLERVMVAVDLNERDEVAASYAYSIVKPGGRVRLVYVESRTPTPPEFLGEGVMIPETDEKEEAARVEKIKERLRAFCPEEAQARGVRTEVELLDAMEPAQALCEAAERFNADLICVGGHTRPGFLAKVMGSVALGVLTHSERPVLVVRPPKD